MRRCRIFVIGPGLFVSLSVFVVSFRSLVVGGWWMVVGCWLVGWLVVWLVGWLVGWLVSWLVFVGRRAVLLVPVVTAPDE